MSFINDGSILNHLLFIYVQGMKTKRKTWSRKIQSWLEELFDS